MNCTHTGLIKVLAHFPSYGNKILEYVAGYLISTTISHLLIKHMHI